MKTSRMAMRAAIAIVGAAIMAATVGCGAASAAPAAQQACTDLGGIVAADQTCHVHSEAPTYTIDITYPLDYPDPNAVSDFVAADRKEFVDWVSETRPDGRNRPYTYTVRAKTYRSEQFATQSLVLAIDNDTGAAHQGHPARAFKSFNRNLTAQAPITFDTLFKPGAKPLDVLTPLVRRELHAPTLKLLASDCRNFALTDDAVVFFFGEGQLIPGENSGPHQISVARSELAPLMAG